MIDSSVIYVKTAKGEEAIRNRSGLGDLPADLRMVLLLVNGIRTVSGLQMVSEPCHESVAPLIFLEDNGYIVRSEAPPRHAMAGVGGMATPNPTVVRFPSHVNDQMLAREQAVAPAPVPAQPPMAMPQPMQAQLHEHNPVADSVALTRSKDESLLRARLRELNSYLIRTLGEDSAAVIKRVNEVEDEQQYFSLTRKLYEILREYRGTREAENFMQRFEKL